MVGGCDFLTTEVSSAVKAQNALGDVSYKAAAAADIIGGYAIVLCCCERYTAYIQQAILHFTNQAAKIGIFINFHCRRGGGNILDLNIAAFAHRANDAAVGGSIISAGGGDCNLIRGVANTQ